MNFLGLLRRHPVITYFVMAFGITWVSIWLIVTPTGIPGKSEDITQLLPLVFLAMIAGPSISTIVLTGVADGQNGYRKLFARLAIFRVAAGWYATLLMSPVLLALILGLLSLRSTLFVPGILSTSDKIGLLAFALVAGLAAGVFEEVGWTGFATSRILTRHGLLATTLLVGVPWAIWHDLAGYWGGAQKYGELYWVDLALWLVALTAYRYVIVWAYSHTASLPLAMLLHTSFTASQAILSPAAFVAANDVVWYGIFAITLCLIAGIVSRTEAIRHASLPARTRSVATYAA